MDDSKLQENIDGKFIFPYVPHEHHDGLKSQNSLVNFLKYSLLLGADNVLMARKSPASSVCSLSEPEKMYEDYDSAERIRKGKFPLQYDDKKVCGNNFECSSLDFPQRVVEFPSKSHKNEFPMDIVAFFTLLVLKLVGFQISLLMRFLTLPYSIFNFWLTLLMFPFQTMVLARDHIKRKLLKLWGDSCARVISFIFIKFKIQKSLLKLAVRFCWASFWSIYVCLILVGLLIMGFVIGGIAIRHLVIEPIQRTENLNFDYTKTSPVAFVPLVSGVSPGLISKDKTPSVGARFIPYDHKLQLSVSLTMPESEYNRNLGIFQVCLTQIAKAI